MTKLGPILVLLFAIVSTQSALAAGTDDVNAAGKALDDACKAYRDKQNRVEAELNATVTKWLEEVSTTLNQVDLTKAKAGAKKAVEAEDRNQGSVNTIIDQEVEPTAAKLRTQFTDKQADITGVECNAIHIERWVMGIERATKPQLGIVSVGRDLGAFEYLAMVGAVCLDTAPKVAFSTAYLTLSDMAREQKPTLISRPGAVPKNCN